MNINYKNIQNIETIYIHDSFFNGFTYDHLAKELVIYCDNSQEKIRYKFVFEGLLFIKFTGCQFWGEGNRILNWTVDSNALELKKLREYQNSNPNFDCSQLAEVEDFTLISICLQINSGDELYIICNSIQVSTNSL